MRLVCPNCEAKYEVPDDAIPDTGRDVQCANCGHAWFQMRARPASAAAIPAVAPPVAKEATTEPEPVPEPDVVVAEPAPAPETAAETAPETAVELDPAPADEPEAVADPEPQPAPEPPAEPAPDVAPVSEAEADPDLLPEPEATLEAERAAAAGYAVDDSVLAILREEAEREANARRAEARALETQTDLGLEAAPPVKDIAAEPVAPADLAEVDTRPAARRDLLPDVEEINSTLSPSELAGEDGAEAALPPQAQTRSGFRGGFLTVMVASIIAASVYLAAPQLGGLIPGLEGPLSAYVGYVDGLRLALDGMMRSATVAINGG